MKKFKLIWDERVCDVNGDMLHMEQKTQIIEAENEDAACDQWNKENEHNEYQNDLDDVYEIVEHALFLKRLCVDMPNGVTYGVPVEVIARHRAEVYKDEFNDDLAESLREDTIPLFESDNYEIRDWAANNMNWSDVKDLAIVIKNNTPPDEDFEDAWCNGEYSVT